MNSKHLKTHKMTSIVFLFLFTRLIFLYPQTCNSKLIPQFKTILIFGDSTVDTGNNNYLGTYLKSNHKPYGNSLPGKNATGRFSNGKLPCDLVASSLGIKEFVPPSLDPNLSNDDLRTGVSFASSGSGYDDLTSRETGAIPMSKQPDHFRSYIERLKGFLGEKEAMNIVNNALILVSAGVNDFIFNYYGLPTRKLQYTIEEYQSFVLNKLQDFVKELYSLGCRWIVVGGIPPVGCLPLQMTIKLRLRRTCLDYQNKDAQSYNQKLPNILKQLQSSLPRSKILYADIYTTIYNMTTNPQAYGFTKTRRGCCGTGLLEVGPFCSVLSPMCSNASQYIYFDSVHPTETAYRYLSEAIEKQLISQLLQHHQEITETTELAHISPSNIEWIFKKN